MIKIAEAILKKKKTGIENSDPSKMQRMKLYETAYNITRSTRWKRLPL